MHIVKFFLLAAIPLCLPILYAEHNNVTTTPSTNNVIMGRKPTLYPTKKPSPYPTRFPTKFPTDGPTTGFPSKEPTKTPTNYPTLTPSYSPTTLPTMAPSIRPDCIHKNANWHDWWCQMDCAERIKEYPNRCMWNPSMSPTVRPSISPSLTPCPPGHHLDLNSPIDACVKCEKGTYNHGGMPRPREFCYTIPEKAEFAYLNSVDVRCRTGWMGIPIYHDGEYEEGCVDVPEPSPTLFPASSPTTIPIVPPTVAPVVAPTVAPVVAPPAQHFQVTTAPTETSFWDKNDTVLLVICVLLSVLVFFFCSFIFLKILKNRRQRGVQDLQNTIIRTIELSNVRNNTRNAGITDTG